MTMMGWGYGAGPGWVVMILMMLGFWTLVVLAGVAVLRGTGGRGRSDDGRPRDHDH